MATSRIVTLAKAIEANTTKLDDYLDKNNLPRPSFDADAPLRYQLPPDIAAAQEALTADLDELYWLNRGPISTVTAKTVITLLNSSPRFDGTLSPQDGSSIGLQTILRYNIQTLVPLDSGATFQELADKTGVPVKKLTRLLRFGMTDHFFRESEPGYVKHTAASKALLQIPLLASFSLMSMQEIEYARMHLVDAIAKWPESEEPEHAGFCIANNTTKPMFEFLEENSERMNRFKDAMSFLQSFPGLETSFTVKGFDWASLGDGLVVDVGGSHGLVSQDLARAFPNLRFVVQDLPKVVESAQAKLPADFEDRLTFMAHDMFTEQPVKGADVYYFRWILHDWPDKYRVKILKSLIPALKSGARIILSERCLEPPCTGSFSREKANRDADMTMLAIHNAQERDQNDWEELLRFTDPKLKLEEIRKIPKSTLAMIIARWQG